MKSTILEKPAYYSKSMEIIQLQIFTNQWCTATAQRINMVRYDGQDISANYKSYFSYFSTQTYVVGTQKNRLNETVHLSVKNKRLNR